MAASKRTASEVVAKAAPITAPPVVTIPPLNRPATCGQHFALFADKALAAEGCKRLPRHHGDHKPEKPRGLMTSAERARASASKVASKVAPKSASKIVTIAGAKYTVPLDKAGQPIFARATWVVTPEPAVRVIPEAKSRRRVASTRGR